MRAKVLEALAAPWAGQYPLPPPGIFVIDLPPITRDFWLLRGFAVFALPSSKLLEPDDTRVRPSVSLVPSLRPPCLECDEPIVIALSFRGLSRPDKPSPAHYKRSLSDILPEEASRSNTGLACTEFPISTCHGFDDTAVLASCIHSAANSQSCVSGKAGMPWVK